jgi:hypothetical protein
MFMQLYLVFKRQEIQRGFWKYHEPGPLQSIADFVNQQASDGAENRRIAPHG